MLGRFHNLVFLRLLFDVICDQAEVLECSGAKLYLRR